MLFPFSKSMTVMLTVSLFLLTSLASYSQCDVVITPLGPTSFCEGGSVTLSASASGDSLQLDQSQTLYNGGTSARNLPGYSYWQSFTAGLTGTLVQIDAGFFTFIDGTGFWTVWEGSGTGGTMLDSQVVNIYCNGGNCLLSFEENIEVVEGNTYTFQIRGGTGMPDPYGLQIGAGNPYTQGTMGFVDPSGTYLTDFDWVFNTWVESGGVTYLWSTGETDSFITVTESGDYTVIVNGAGGCTDSATEQVTVYELPDVTMNSADDSVCVSDATVALYGEPYGGVFSGPGVSYNVFAPSAPGNYTIFYSYTDGYGCTNTDSIVIVVEVCSGADEVLPENEISCFVSGDRFFIHTGNDLSGATCRITNSQGATVLNGMLDGPENSFGVQHLAAGIYYYQLQRNGRSIAAGKFYYGK